MPPQVTLEPEIDSLDEMTPHPEGYRAVLTNSNFLALWIGQILSQLGDRIVFVAFIASIVAHFGSSDRYNSFLYIAFTIPAILLTAVAGVFVDRWPRRMTLVLTNVIRGGLVLMLPWAAKSGLMPLYGLAFLLSAATQFFVPAEAATIPTIVRKSQLITANSLFTTTMMGSVIFGFALGDPLINIFSLQEVHWPIGALFLLAAVSLMFVRTPPVCWLPSLEESPNLAPPKARSVSDAVGRFVGELREGVSYIRETPQVLRAILKLATLFSAIVALCILCVSFAKEFLFSSPALAARKFAYIITFSGIGMVLGAFAVGRYGHPIPRGLMVYGGFVVIGLCLLMLSAIGWLPQGQMMVALPPMHLGALWLDAVHLTSRMVLTYSLAAILGFGAAFVAIPLQARIHELIPEDKRGKILGVQFTILSTSSTLPVLIAGLGVEQFGSQLMFLVIGLVLLVLGARGLTLGHQRL